MKKRLIFFFLLITGCLLLIQCAAEKPPGGGPPDTEPPFLVSSSLASGAVNIDSLHVLHFTFSEPLNAKTAEKGITLFPLNENPVEIRIRGRNIRITPLTPWKKGIVYTVILGKTIADLRNNSLQEPLQFSFTVSGSMPQNRISGRVAGQKKNTNTFIHISRTQHIPDSIFAHPDYYTQSAPDGSFSFYYLPEDTFYIAGYQDLDKSNSFNKNFDGVCVPAKRAVFPDTIKDITVYLLATENNFLPPKLLKAENLYPGATELSFTKKPAVWNKRNSFRLGDAEPDTVLYSDNSCVLYHERLRADSVKLSLRNVKDHLNCELTDTLVRIAVNEMDDSLYHFTQHDDILFIMPPPGTAVLSGRFEGPRDTVELTLTQKKHGMYDIPSSDPSVRGKWHVSIPESKAYPEILTDSIYAVELKRKAPPEYGAVLGNIHPQKKNIPCRMVLKNETGHYETYCRNERFLFEKVLPGNYTLSFYIDRNQNRRADPGRPYPYRAPEIIHELDRNIQVRARWDTELEDAYEIDIDNDI